MNSVSGRLFVCDPTCVLPFGHTVVALHYFGKSFGSGFRETFLLSGRDLDEGIADKYGFERRFRFYYRDYIPLPQDDESLEKSDIQPHFIDRLEAAATEDARALLADYAIDQHDTIIYPGLDIYGVLGLLNCLLRAGAAQPKVFLRFIGVMENASKALRSPLHELAGRIREALALGVRLSFSAETPKYADELSSLLKTVVGVTPYPFVGETLPLSDVGPLIVSCPGSARIDKGYLQLFGIFAAVRRRDPDLTIRFVSQILPDREAISWESYTSQLYAIPGVRLLQSILTEEEIISNYRDSHLILLPYDAATYALRGSAVMMESAYFGRRIVMLEGPAFADQVRYFGLGDVVADADAMAERILELSRWPRKRLYSTTQQARHRFVSDATGAYAQWLQAAI